MQPRVKSAGSRGLRLKRTALITLILIGSVISPLHAAEGVDRIIAIVEDEVILESELIKRMDVVKHSLSQGDTPPPSGVALAKQVLDKLVMEKIQISMAARMGLKVDDETLRQAVGQIAQKNNISTEELRNSLRGEGIEYSDFLEQIRGELAQQRLRSSQVNSQIKISDREVEKWLKDRGENASNPDTEFLLGHILISTPSAASPQAIKDAKERADQLVKELKSGLDFKQASLSRSDSSEALKGGDLGWRKMAAMPTIFVEVVPKMRKGDIDGPIRSPSGFHIIKLLDVRGGAIDTITKTHVRHILIKPSELLTNEDARKKLLAIRARVEAGDDFGDLARGNSDDKGSAVKGGDLGFVGPGALVPEFEQAMIALDLNQLSEPVQSQFGWHLIQVLERQESTDTNELLKKQAQNDIFNRKVGEETELWMRRIRDEAYVEYRVLELAPDGWKPPEDKTRSEATKESEKDTAAAPEASDTEAEKAPAKESE